MSEQTQTNTGRPKPEIKGKVVAIMDEWRNAAGTFWKREVVVETGYKFPNPLKVAFQKEATAHLDGVAVGDLVTIPYVLNGREFDGRCFGSGLTQPYAPPHRTSNPTLEPLSLKHNLPS